MSPAGASPCASSGSAQDALQRPRLARQDVTLGTVRDAAGLVLSDCGADCGASARNRMTQPKTARLQTGGCRFESCRPCSRDGLAAVLVSDPFDLEKLVAPFFVP